LVPGVESRKIFDFQLSTPGTYQGGEGFEEQSNQRRESRADFSNNLLKYIFELGRGKVDEEDKRQGIRLAGFNKR